MVLGCVHLFATPHIPHLLDDMPPKARDFAVGPTLLNHVLAGILLLPLGFATWLAAAEDHLSEPWAKRILVANCLTVLVLPVMVVLLMSQPQYYQSPLFMGGVVLTALTAVLMAVAAWVAASAKA
jgi:hypothetical protein